MFVQEYWQQSFQNNPYPCLIVDAAYQVLECNPAANLLMKEMTPFPLQKFLPDVRSFLVQNYAFSSNDIVRFDSVYKGVLLAFEMHKLGEVLFLKGCVFEQEHSQENRFAQLGILSGGLFHAIRNPLAVIQGRIELLQMTIQSKNVLKNLDIMFSQCENIGQWLDATQKIMLKPLQISHFNLYTLLQNTLDTLNHADEKQFPVLLDSRFKTDKVETRIENDERKLGIALYKVLELYLKHGYISQVSIEDCQNTINILIEGNLHVEGWGLLEPLLNASKVELNATPSTNNFNSNLLHIALNMCGMVISKNQLDQLCIQISKKWHHSSNNHSNKLNVLIVDDDIILRETLMQLLGLDGHYIETASSAEEAIDLWSDRFDVVLLDVFLPQKSGIELLADIATQNPEWLKNVLLISGMGDFQTDMLPEGVRFLPKPFSKATLIQEMYALKNR